MYNRGMGEPKKRSLRRRLGVPVLRSLAWLGGRLPPRSNRRFARVLTRVSARFTTRERRQALGTLSLAQIPVRILDPQRFVSRVFENFGKAVLDTVSALAHWPGIVDEIVEPDSVRAFGEAIRETHRAAGRLIYLTCHLGNWEILGGIATRVKPVAAVAKRLHYAEYQVFAEKVRNTLGYQIFYQDDPLRRMLRFLRDGNTLALLPDQDIPRNAGVFVPFFGRDAYSPLGPAILSALSHAPVLPVFMPHTENGYRIVFHDVIPPPSDRSDGALRRFTEVCQRAVERIITEYPDQWAWFHDRYRTRPEDIG